MLRRFGGGFSYIPRNVSHVNLIEYMCSRKNVSYELLHMKACKRSLNISRRSTNLASLGELGRFPLIFNIMAAVLKYRVRLESSAATDPLFHALQSQKNLSKTNRTSSFYIFTNTLFKQINLDIEVLKTLDVNASNKSIVQTLKVQFTKQFIDSLNEVRVKDDTKLNIYVQLKHVLKFESYLKYSNSRSIITKFRISDHHLPIERGRYSRPKLPRISRVCTLCHSGVGDELHAMFYCPHLELALPRSKFLTLIYSISPQISILPPNDQMLYILAAVENDLLSATSSWLVHINKIYKDNLSMGK